MALDRFASRFLALIQAGARDHSTEPSLEDMRRATDALASFAAGPREVEARDDFAPGQAGPIPIRIYSPASTGEQALPGLIYFHGGGWLSGGFDSHDGLCRALAKESGCRIIAVGYRLAPEHRFPAAIADCHAAVSFLCAEAKRFGLDRGRIGVAGDSAGGNLAAVVCRLARETGPPIALQVLLCPVLDALGRTPSRHALGSGYFLEERIMVLYFQHYRIDGLDPDDPLVSPLRADDFHDLPPARIHTAEYDPLQDEAALYAERLALAGVDVRLRRHPGMIHHFYGLSGAIPYAKIGLAAIGADIREALA